MKPRIISVFLFLVMMIIVVHIAIPHHHHEEIVMHNHDVHDDNADAHAGKDHDPVKCIIQNIDFNVPKALSNVRSETPSIEVDSFISTLRFILFSDTWFVASYIAIPPGDPPLPGIIPASPPRAPPCGLFFCFISGQANNLKIIIIIHFIKNQDESSIFYTPVPGNGNDRMPE
ncbi:MAG: DUF6769 family protein [Candidatus Gracilibacteria bacterium]